MTDFWEQWVASTAEPVEYLQRDATVRRETVSTVVTRDDLFGGSTDVASRPGRKLITFTYERAGARVVCQDMPDNAPTAACVQRRHDQCNHRLGSVAEGGVLLTHAPTRFVWRCGCPCHRDPARAGMLL